MRARLKDARLAIDVKTMRKVFTFFEYLIMGRARGKNINYKNIPYTRVYHEYYPFAVWKTGPNIPAQMA